MVVLRSGPIGIQGKPADEVGFHYSGTWIANKKWSTGSHKEWTYWSLHSRSAMDEVSPGCRKLRNCYLMPHLSNRESKYSGSLCQRSPAALAAEPLPLDFPGT